MSEVGSTDFNVAATPRALEGLEDTKLPFAFARRFGVVLVPDQLQQVLEVCAKSQPSLSTLAEIRRHVRRKIKLRVVASEEFVAHLRIAGIKAPIYVTGLPYGKEEVMSRMRIKQIMIAKDVNKKHCSPARFVTRKKSKR